MRRRANTSSAWVARARTARRASVRLIPPTSTPAMRVPARRWFDSARSYANAAIVVPAKTPKAIVDKLHAAVVQAANAPEVKEKLRTIGSEAISMASPAEFPPFLQRELNRWAEVVRAAGLEKK